MNSKELLAILKENNIEFVSKSQILAKDYYKLQNLTADTKMRNSIGGNKDTKNGGEKPDGHH